MRNARSEVKVWVFTNSSPVRYRIAKPRIAFYKRISRKVMVKKPAGLTAVRFRLS